MKTTIDFKNFTFQLNETSFISLLPILVLGLITLLLAIIALLKLRRRPMDETSRAIWAFVILYTPFVGPIVFFIVRPGNIPDEVRRYA
ncbi:MAG: PLDc_N domain-containing protein [Verrucomicrobia bacterium]|nr:PLDc_N domain-containing protein [Verrucomicrobiota bacterium]